MANVSHWTPGAGCAIPAQCTQTIAEQSGRAMVTRWYGSQDGGSARHLIESYSLALVRRTSVAQVIRISLSFIYVGVLHSLGIFLLLPVPVLSFNLTQLQEQRSSGHFHR